MIRAKIGVIFFILSTFIIICVCDIITPWLYRHVETDHYRTILLLNKVKEPNFNPDLMVLGSSKSMSGINAYLMTKKLGIDCYNFSSSNQSPEEGSLFFSELPSSLKTLIMVIFPPIRDVGAPEENYILPANVSTAFVFGHYKLGKEIKQINEFSDLSSLERHPFLLNLDARGSIVIPGLYNFFRPKLEAGTVDFKYPYAYMEEKLPTYEESVSNFKINSHVGKEIEWDENVLKTLNNYDKYLKTKGIDFMIALLPTNPDVEEFSKEQLHWINENISSQLPGIRIFNYLSSETSSDMFFDAIHLNRIGGKYVTELLITDLRPILFAIKE